MAKDATGIYQEYQFVAELYDHVNPYVSRPDIAFYVEQAEKCGGPVLELGCGTGRVLIPIARAGIKITGIDLSEHMLSICRQKLFSEPTEVKGRVSLIRGDIREFELDRLFKLVTIPFRPFQHLLTVEDQLDCLRHAYTHLEPSGCLALDLFNPDMKRLVKSILLTKDVKSLHS